MTYPQGFGRCIMCGVERNQPCVVISTVHDEHYSQTAGDPRPAAHHARSLIGGVNEPQSGFVAVKDEPNHYRGQPHTPQCGPDCPLSDVAETGSDE